MIAERVVNVLLEDPKEFLADHPEIGSFDYFVKGSHGMGWGTLGGPFKSAAEAVAWAQANAILDSHKFGRVSKCPAVQGIAKIDFLRQCVGWWLGRDKSGYKLVADDVPVPNADAP